VFKINYKIQEKSRYFTRNQRVSRYPERWQAKSSQQILRYFANGRWAIIPLNRSRIVNHWNVIRLKAILFDKEQEFQTLLLQSLYRVTKAKT